MTKQTEIAILKHFENNDELQVTLVDSNGDSKEHTFVNQYEALMDIPNLESEYTVYGPF